MQTLSQATKLKLVIPFIYFAAANTMFTLMLDNNRFNYQLLGIVMTDVAFVLWLTARVQLGNAFSIAPKSTFLVKTGL